MTLRHRFEPCGSASSGEGSRPCLEKDASILKMPKACEAELTPMPQVIAVPPSIAALLPRTSPDLSLGRIRIPRRSPKPPAMVRRRNSYAGLMVAPLPPLPEEVGVSAVQAGQRPAVQPGPFPESRDLARRAHWHTSSARQIVDAPLDVHRLALRS